ncbi:putative isomerase YbhE [Punctularia strigosozonata HHB-11173 SS5]|uniref:Putative isomerase YbhE n=1 Tax=Punctularia strigosozonata (strain HHB-11173) TaxID=741275 RepID=R7S2L3_PUNST|nr:putative isomerase YbhE [Punctularia strigosozonata HHB-11173 SS5]EIN04630.1 putative isomerase YbhE [Punctularia strigosozonata HHB-11173 SS5]
MVNFTILAGGYTTFVASYLFNSDAKTLSLLNTSPTGANPSWIVGHPTNQRILYATNENDPTGGLQSFTIGPQGVLTSVEDVSSDGGSPAFCVPLSTGQVAIMNYDGGNGKIVPTTTDPLHFADADLVTFPATVSHPHMALQHGKEVLVPDLGADKIWRLVEDGAPGRWKIQGDIPQPSGSGPRHIAVFNNTLFALHELASTLTAQAFPAAPNGTSAISANVSILPPALPAGAAMAAGEILIPPPSPAFPVPYVYVSNRNTGVLPPEGDAVAVFEPVFRSPSDVELKLVTHVFTGLDQIRGMIVGGPEDRYLIAGGVAGSAGVVMLERTQGGRNLTIVARNTELPTRTSFVWLEEGRYTI